MIMNIPQRSGPKFLLIKAACFEQVWTSYYAHLQATSSSKSSWNWRHFLTWAYATYPGQVKTSSDFLVDVILTSEWKMVQDVLIEVQDDPAEDPV